MTEYDKIKQQPNDKMYTKVELLTTMLEFADWVHDDLLDSRDAEYAAQEIVNLTGSISYQLNTILENMPAHTPPWKDITREMPQGFWHMEGCSPQRLIVKQRTPGNNDSHCSEEALYFDDTNMFMVRNICGELLDITENVVAWMPMPDTD